MFTTRPELRGTFGMVASTHWLASAAGMAVLEQGGNAFDAAVAAGFTLQVVEPHLNGPGRRPAGAALARRRRRPSCSAAQGPAPRAATIAHYRDELGLDLVPGTGPLAAVVPGSFGGWLTMLRDHGTLPLARRAALRDRLRRDGYPVLPQIAGAIRNVEQLFRDEWTTSAEVYLPVPRAGRRCTATRSSPRRTGGSSTSRAEIVDAALDCWYRGFVAEAFVALPGARVDGQLRRAPRGPLAADDLRDWRAVATSRRSRSTTTASRC